MKTRLLILLLIFGMLPILILSMSMTAISQEDEPPLKQIKYTHPTNVVCKENLVLHFKYDNKPVCMDIFTIVDIEKRNRDYFTLFNMDEFQIIGSWNPNLGERFIYDPSVFYSNEQPRPDVGTVLWQDEEAEYEIKYRMINGSSITMLAVNLLQDPSDRHTWPIEITYRGDENTILIFELPDDLELKNAVGMHMEQFERQNIVFPFIDPEKKTNRQIIISDLSPDENGFVYMELAFLGNDHKYEVAEIPQYIGRKFLSENPVDLNNVSKSYCEVKGGQYKNHRCLFVETSSRYECDTWDFYITSQCKP